MSSKDRLRRIFRSSPSTPPIVDISDGLVAIARVIGEDKQLRQWFQYIATAPDNVRVSEVGRLTSKMTAGGEDEKTVGAFRLLAEGATCELMLRVIRERYGPDNRVTS